MRPWLEDTVTYAAFRVLAFAVFLKRRYTLTDAVIDLVAVGLLLILNLWEEHDHA